MLFFQGQGMKVSRVDFRKDKSEILTELLEHDPMVVGFSVIFEYHLYRFQELIEYSEKEWRSKSFYCRRAFCQPEAR
jgi:methylmalonyl-CoA mutase cobalamin-binding subunit